MKYTTAFIMLLSISATTWALKVTTKQTLFDKRDAGIGRYPSSGHSLQSFDTPAYHSPPSFHLQNGQSDSNAISIGAGYSIGGGSKPSYGYKTPEAHGGLVASEGFQSSGQGTIKLPPITLDSKGLLSNSDLSNLMKELSYGVNSGAINLSPFQQADGESNQHSNYNNQLPQFSYGPSQLQQHVSSVPSYAAGTKGLGSYGTGPVLFNPDSYNAPQQVHRQALSAEYAPGHSSLQGLLAPVNSEYSLGNADYSVGGAGPAFSGKAGLSLHGSENSLSGSGHSLSNSGHSLVGFGHSLGSSGLSLGGGYGSFKKFGSRYVLPNKSFKPFVFLAPNNVMAGSYDAPSSSFGTQSSNSYSVQPQGSVSYDGFTNGFSGSSSKLVSPLSPKPEGFVESLDAFSLSGQSASPPGTTYGIPSSSYSVPSGNSHASSTHNQSPPYYISSSKSFSEGSSSPMAPSSGHSAQSAFNLVPKYSYSQSVPKYSRSTHKDTHGAQSETQYNTIKYSEEMRPRYLA